MQPTTTPGAATAQYLSFRLGGLEYGLDYRCVRELRPLKELDRFSSEGDVLPAAGKANKTDFPVVSPVVTAAAPAAPVRDKRKEAEDRQKAAALRKPIENKIKRQEEQIAKRNAQKAETDAKLGEPTIYDAANKAKLKQLLADQTFFTKDLAQLEAEWLDLQDQLEKLG